jgi:hypothetical protein
MNMAEALAREIYRCGRIVGHLDDIGAAGEPLKIIMGAAVERAFAAAGSGDVVTVLRSHAELKDFSE